MKSPYLQYIFRYGIFLALLVATFSLCILSINRASAQTVPDLKIEAMDEEGNPVGIDWRTSSTWIWDQDRLVLQVWIAVPKMLANSIVESKNVIVKHHGQVSLLQRAPDQSYLAVKMRGPTELVKLRDLQVAENNLKAIQIDARAEKTTWLRNTECRHLRLSLREQQRLAEGPLFLGVHCNSLTENDTAVEVIVSSSQESNAKISPFGRARTTGKNKFLIPKSMLRRSADVAQIIIESETGRPIASYTVTTEAPAPKPQILAQVASETPKAKLKQTFVVSARGQAVQIDSKSFGGSNKMVPTLALSWTGQQPNQNYRLSAEIKAPVSQLADRADPNTGSSLGWFRLGSHHLSSPSAQWGTLFGVQGARLRLQREKLFEDLDAFSPFIAFGRTAEYSKSITWQAWIAPLDVAHGLSLIGLRGSYPFTDGEGSATGVYAEIMAGRSQSPVGRDWSMTGYEVGIQGRF